MSERWMSLPRGVLLLSLVSWGLLGATGPLASPTVRAQEIDCNDEANFKDWDCVQKRQAALQAEPAGAPSPAEGAPSDAPPPPDTVAKADDPTAIIFTIEDAGKEATQFLAEQGTDNRGRRTQRHRHQGLGRQGRRGGDRPLQGAGGDQELPRAHQRREDHRAERAVQVRERRRGDLRRQLVLRRRQRRDLAPRPPGRPEGQECRRALPVRPRRRPQRGEQHPDQRPGRLVRPQARRPPVDE
jgi:hypothetical protein